MEEEEGFQQGEEEVDQVVAAADMGEFVGEEGFDLFGGKAAEQPQGQEYDGFEVPDDEGGVYQGGFQERRRFGRMECLCECLKTLLPIERYGLDRYFGQSPGIGPGAEQAEGKKSYAQEPYRRDEGDIPVEKDREEVQVVLPGGTFASGCSIGWGRKSVQQRFRAVVHRFVCLIEDGKRSYRGDQGEELCAYGQAVAHIGWFSAQGSQAQGEEQGDERALPQGVYDGPAEGLYQGGRQLADRCAEHAKPGEEQHVHTGFILVFVFQFFQSAT